VKIDRRRFLAGTAGAGALFALPPVSRAEISRRLQEGPASLVRLIEETPRDRLVEEVAARVKTGAPYAAVLAALMTAGVRNVRPRPSVGFKFHAVMAIHSCHQAALESGDRDRWLPLFWSLDNFKGSQAEEKKVSGWTMGAVDETALPAPHKTRDLFLQAMTEWDEAKADVAAAALARHGTAHEAFELFARHAARDFRSIGHKAIFTAGAFRLLDVVGWSHAEPILRSLAHALLARENSDPKDLNNPADRAWASNRERAVKIAPAWRSGKADDAAALDFLKALRTGSDGELAGTAAGLLERGVGPQSLWDALFVFAGEILMRRPNILSLHAETTYNAIRHLYDTTADDETRRLLLLQASSFAANFRGDLKGARDLKLDELEAAEASDPAAVFADVPNDRLGAARKVLGYLSKGSASSLVDEARRLTVLKGSDAHDYKFSSAALEDYAKISPSWRGRFLASSVFWLKGGGSKDNGLLSRVKSALQA
jgi:hypothetical protein